MQREGEVLNTGKGSTVALITGGGMVVLAGVLSSDALRVLVWHAPVALGVVAAATGLGLWLVRLLGLQDAELRWHLIAGAGLGLGAFSLLVLAFGACGLMSRPLWIAIMAACGAAGFGRLGFLKRNRLAAAAGAQRSPLIWLWVPTLVFGAYALLGATMPPGLLWIEEGRGYDVLEYHLGAPRAYYDAGIITYLPGNIYSNFPFNAEMLYLLSMMLHGDAIDAMYTAKLVNCLLALLAVSAIWLVARENGARSGIIAGVVAAGCPFLVYLSGVAYVENNLVFYAALALAALARSCRAERGMGRWGLLAGLFAGLACGCKYTGVPAVALPLLLATVWLASRKGTAGWRLPLVFVAGAAVTFAPWLLKNFIFTGNPVFPLAYSALGANDGIWNEDLATRWHEGHLPHPDQRAPAERLARFGAEVLAARLFGGLIVVGLSAGLVLLFMRRGAADEDDDPRSAASLRVACWLMIVIGSGTWLGATHLVGRFAIVLIVPCAVFVGHATCISASRYYRTGLVAAVLAMTGLNLPVVVSWFHDPAVAGLPTRQSYLEAGLFGLTDLFTSGGHIERINEITAASGKVLVVGDARSLYLNPGADCCVVFNRNPFAEAAESRSPAELLQWLRGQGYTHVYVDWREMEPLRGTYGFWDALKPTLFQAMQLSGLVALENFGADSSGGPASTIYTIPQERQNEYSPRLPAVTRH